MNNKPDKNKIQTIPPYKVFFNWDIIHQCNFRCTYCPFTVRGWEKYDPPSVIPPLQDLLAAWERMYSLYGPCHIMMSGGEPSLYEHFYELIGTIGKRHTLEIVTNLSFDAERFLKTINPKHVRLATSLHLDGTTEDSFLAKATLLKQAGVEVFTNFVAYPGNLPKMKRIHEMFMEKSIPFFILPYSGVYKDRIYPRDYTDDELKLYEEALYVNKKDFEVNRHVLNFKTKENLPDIVPGPNGPVRIARPKDAEPAKPVTRNCRMGQMYAKIYPDGRTLRCCAFVMKEGIVYPELLGNIFKDKNFRLLDDSAPCSHSPCPCERCMTVGDESKWEHRWKINLEPIE